MSYKKRSKKIIVERFGEQKNSIIVLALKNAKHSWGQANPIKKGSGYKNNRYLSFKKAMFYLMITLYWLWPVMTT